MYLPAEDCDGRSSGSALNDTEAEMEIGTVRTVSAKAGIATALRPANPSRTTDTQMAKGLGPQAICRMNSYNTRNWSGMR